MSDSSSFFAFRNALSGSFFTILFIMRAGLPGRDQELIAEADEVAAAFAEESFYTFCIVEGSPPRMVVGSRPV